MNANNNNNPPNNKKLYILIPIDFLKLKKNNSFNKNTLLNYLLSTSIILLYIYTIINFLSTNYNSLLAKTLNFIFILGVSIFISFNIVR